MKYILYTLILITIGCQTPIDQEYGDAGSFPGNEQMASIRAVYCLRDMLIGEDAGGVWDVLDQPDGSNIDTLLIGDNPCIQWSDQVCGYYELRYIVGDECCRDTSIVKPLKCCMTVTITGDSLLCPGESSTLTATSTGASPYTYVWSGGGTSITKVVSSGGTYTVTVTDANGCTKTDSHVVTMNPVIVISLTPTNGSCGILGSITSLTTGGTSPYTLLWNTGATTNNISGLSNGTYTLTVTDAKGCTKTASAVITSESLFVSISCFPES